MKKYLNGKEVEMTSQEILEHQELQALAQEDNKIIEQQKKETLDNQVSGNQKLLDLGLTQAEATALTGYKPPEDEE
tara:strand:+ start:1162 stop:1389 length:228 start_codon:yes stop_codon:yes gene_type:complete